MNAFSSGAPSTVVDREGERRILEEMISGARLGASRAFGLVGDAGMGKTTLLDHAAYLATSGTSIQVKRISGIEAERRLGFGALHRLLLPSESDLVRLPRSQRDAMVSAFGLLEGDSPDVYLVGLASLTMLAAMSSDGLLCLIDDAHWLDPESARALAFISRRLKAEGIAIVFAMRSSRDVESEFQGIELRTLGGLPDGAALQLLTSNVSGYLDRKVADRVIDQTEGCPLALVEVTDELTLDQWSGVEELVGPLPIRSDLESRFGERVLQLSPASQFFLLVAACESTGDPRIVRKVANSLGTDENDELLAKVSGFIDITQRIQFRHPLVRSAVYANATPSQRREVHLALANVIDASLDPERRAQHLIAATEGLDDGLAEEIVRIAGRARRKGSRSSEAGLLSQAARLSSVPERRSVLLLEAAEAAMAAGAPLRASSLLRQAEQYLEEPVSVADAHRLEGRLQAPLGKPVEAPRLLLQAAREFHLLDEHRSRGALVDAFDRYQIGQYYTPDRVLQEMLELAVRIAPDEPETVDDFVLVALKCIASGKRDEEAMALKHCADMFRTGALSAGDITRLGLSGNNVHNALWDDAGYLQWSERVVTQCRRTGDLTTLPYALCALADGKLRSGLFAAAEVDLAEMLEIVEATLPGVSAFRPMAVKLLCWRGQEREGRAAANALIEGGGAIGSGSAVFHGKNALAILELGLGNYREALVAAQFIMERRSFGWEDLTLQYVVEAATRLGEIEVARVALDRISERALATGSPWAFGQLRISEALLSAESDPEPLFVEGLEYLATTTAATDVARAHLLYGEWLRRVRRRIDAREELRKALEMFASMGASAFATRAESELRATGERARRRVVATKNDLTPQERHVAELAARGATNQEIATELFISASTVDYHLRKVYRKLGIGTRRQLGKSMSPAQLAELEFE